jgi:hypothetical protein
MSWKCPHCGFDTELAPLVIKDRERVASCPRCDRAFCGCHRSPGCSESTVDRTGEPCAL